MNASTTGPLYDYCPKCQRSVLDGCSTARPIYDQPVVLASEAKYERVHTDCGTVLEQVVEGQK
jgi:hypothetical protein